MQEVIAIIREYYEHGTQNSDLEKALKKCKKDDLIEFIVCMQSKGAFSNRLVHD